MHWASPLHRGKRAGMCSAAPSPHTHRHRPLEALQISPSQGKLRLMLASGWLASGCRGGCWHGLQKEAGGEGGVHQWSFNLADSSRATSQGAPWHKAHAAPPPSPQGQQVCVRRALERCCCCCAPRPQALQTHAHTRRSQASWCGVAQPARWEKEVG